MTIEQDIAPADVKPVVQDDAWPAWNQRQTRLRELEAGLRRDAAAPGLVFERACLLAETEIADEARNAYLELLTLEPAHLAGLNNLGDTSARDRLSHRRENGLQPGRRDPSDDAMSRANLANVLVERES